MDVGLVVYGGLDRTSGGFRYDRKLVSALEARGDEVDVVSIPWRTYPRHLADGLSRSLRSRLNQPYDVLLQDELCHPSLWRHNRHLDRPKAVVSIVHLLRSGPTSGPTRPLYRAIERRYLESVDAAVCTSHDTHDRTRTLADLPTLVAPPSGRVEGAAHSPKRVESRARGGRLRAVFVGNLLPRKGVRTLLSALARTDRQVELTVVGSHEGDPEYARSARADAYDLGIADRVAFTGEVPSGELDRLLARSHVLAVPASYEGFGMVYLEAMEYGVVPIASAVGGASEIVEHGRNGFLVEPDDPDEIASILSALTADRDALARLGTNALETAARHPTWAVTMGRVRSFLRTVVDDASEGTRTDSLAGGASSANAETGRERGDSA